MAPWSLNALNHQIAPGWSPVGHCSGRGAAAVATFPGVAGNVARAAGDTTANAIVQLKWFDCQHGVVKNDKISTSLVECERVKAKIGKALRADGSPRMWKKFPPARGQKGFLS